MEIVLIITKKLEDIIKLFQVYRMRTLASDLNISDIFSNFMTRRLSLPQLKKYDITQKVIEALADSESRAILFSIIKKGSTASELSDKLKIPLSSVYKKLSDLEELTLIEVEKWMLSDKGRKYKVYRSRISKADISIRKPEPTLTLVSN